MKKPRICVTIVNNNLEAIKEIEPEVSLFEVRLDLVGPGWPELVKYLRKPWIACNRSPEEGGKGDPDEVKRIEELLWAAEAGAVIVDIEYRTKNLADIVSLIKARAQCLISFHDVVETPAYNTLVGIMESQIKAGADICKIVTNAQSFEDNLAVLRLVRDYPETKRIAFAMGEIGRISRILSPLVGGYLTYACLSPGLESAAGQIPVKELNELYRYLRGK
jgi:3-dehydroquinate dehydratase I